MEYIKITDLCVGDWVMYDLKPYIVQQIDGESEHVVISGSEGVREKHIDYIEPICIKPEMLEKNGLVLTEYAKKHNEHRYVDQDALLIKTNYGWHCTIFQGFARDVSMYVRFIHELQHFFRLAKIGQEIEL